MMGRLKFAERTARKLNGCGGCRSTGHSVFVINVTAQALSFLVNLKDMKDSKLIPILFAVLGLLIFGFGLYLTLSVGD